MAGGGRGIERPWRSRSEVPEDIWDGHRWGYPESRGWTDELYLEALNDKYYWYWVRADTEKAEKKGRQLLNGQGPLIMCVGDHCPKKIKRADWRNGKRLCNTCEAEIKAKGRVGYIQYVGAH